MKIPRIKRNTDGDRIRGDATQPAFAREDDYDKLKRQARLSGLVFDYHKTRADLEARYVLYGIGTHAMKITDHGADLVIVEKMDPELGLVIRDALVNYHLEKAEARAAASKA
jgi:hypothetical protein